MWIKMTHLKFLIKYTHLHEKQISIPANNKQKAPVVPLENKDRE